MIRIPTTAVPKSAGMTLVEVLVALAVFATVSVLAFGGLNTVLKTRAGTDEFSKRLGDLQIAMTLLERDLIQAVNRPVRDEYGDPLPALIGGTGEIPGTLELTRAGYRNPAGLPRSNLQRVVWHLEDRVLERAYWSVLDRAQDSALHRVALVDEVDRIDMRFLDHQHEWKTSWPAETTDDKPAGLPRAVEVTLELADWGSITRLFVLPGDNAEAGPDIFAESEDGEDAKEQDQQDDADDDESPDG